jgi:phosphatidylserine/phosphatidylglycerophosphate/cardiolipin synthase-like enzyme
LTEEIQRLAATLPRTTCMAVAQAIADVEPGRWSRLQLRADDAAGGPQGREQIGALLRRWREADSPLPPIAIAAALEAAALAFDSARSVQATELVWTGPPSTLPLRRTAQALQQVIDEAEQALIIVAYAVYAIPEIGQALTRAIGRGVGLSLVVESSQEREGRIAYDNLRAFAPAIREQAAIYHWPATNRPQDATGRSGVLHVKCAVADERLLLISSANLTHYALQLNMEMGLLVRGGELPRQVARHLAELIATGVLTNV